MRIQQTDRILKDARNARHNNNLHTNDRGWMSRMWSKVMSIFK